MDVRAGLVGVSGRQLHGLRRSGSYCIRSRGRDCRLWGCWLCLQHPRDSGHCPGWRELEMGGQSAWVLRQTSLGPSQLADDWLQVRPEFSSFLGPTYRDRGSASLRSFSLRHSTKINCPAAFALASLLTSGVDSPCAPARSNCVVRQPRIGSVTFLFRWSTAAFWALRECDA